MPKTIVTEVTDLAADSPFTYAQLATMHRSGTLAATLAALTPKQRVACAAVVAERTGKDVSDVQRRFARLLNDAEGVTPPPAPASARRTAAGSWIVASDTNPRTSYLISPDLTQCGCPGFKFRGRCKHLNRLIAA
jgi:hypothetical protein